MGVDITIPSLGVKFQDYRDGILGDSYNWQFKLKATDIDYFVMHHSVTAQTAKNDGNWKAECDYIARLHVEKRGWDGVGYRFIICSDGTVAYVGDCGASGSSVANNNNHILSACFVGDFTKELPTAYQVWSAHRLCHFMLFEQRSWVNLYGWDRLLGHKETYNHPDFPNATPTACPSSAWKVAGDNLYTRIVQDNWRGYPPPLPPEIPTTPPPDPEPDPEPDCENAINEAISERDIFWQSQLDSANEDLKKCKEGCLDSLTWQECLKEAYKKFVNRG